MFICVIIDIIQKQTIGETPILAYFILYVDVTFYEDWAKKNLCTETHTDFQSIKAYGEDLLLVHFIVFRLN